MKRSPLPAINRERHAEQHAAQFGEQADRCRRSSCYVCVMRRLKQTTRTVPHHHPTRAAGGLDRDTMPLCEAHHDECHARGFETFWNRYNLNPDAIIARMREPLALIGDWEFMPY